tara:strand:- start:402 stop:716 length:315 start_codon:yes stop_codon:yes gene_type:complete
MKEKRVIFNMPVKKYADFRIRLRHDGLKQYQLFNWLVDKYLSNDADVLESITDLKVAISSQGKSKIAKTRALIDEGNVLKGQFGLTAEDLTTLYDIIEKEIPEV